MIWKLTGDVFLAGIDFASWPLQTGEQLVTTNALGNLNVTVRDDTGKDVTATAIDGSPSIDGTRVLFMLSNALDAGSYKIHASVPTSDDEILTEVVGLRVR